MRDKALETATMKAIMKKHILAAELSTENEIKEFLADKNNMSKICDEMKELYNSHIRHIG